MRFKELRDTPLNGNFKQILQSAKTHFVIGTLLHCSWPLRGGGYKKVNRWALNIILFWLSRINFRKHADNSFKY